MITYNVKLEPQEEGGFVVTVPALPGCNSEGLTVDEALQNIQEAIASCLESMATHGRPIPLEFSETRTVSVSFRKTADKRGKKVYA